MLIREATRDDLPAIVALLRDDALGQTRESPNLAPYQSAFEAISAGPHHTLIVLEIDNQVVGCAQLSFLPNLTFEGAWRAQIEGVRIAASHRGQGIGQALFDDLIDRSKSRNCRIVQLTTNKSRPDAIAFYQRLGFEPTHEGMKLYLDNSAV